MTFIPDSISQSDLLRLQVDAEPDFVPAEPKAHEDLELSIEAFLEAFMEKHPSPIASKQLCLRILSQLGAWHDLIADKTFAEKDNSCLNWAGDEKLIHIAWSCLDRVDLGEGQECTCDED